ncbi:MAG TPA: hypothetical protein VF228_21080 [Iamia sp.]
MARPALLYLTDPAYEARGRRYGDEDLWLSARLRERFTVALAHPVDAVALMDRFDAVVLRNTGPVLGHLDAYWAFRAEAAARGTKVFTDLGAKGDARGKQYLVDLSAAGWPVIPTVARTEDLARLPDADAYVTKPLLGADSVGLEIVAPSALALLDLDGSTLVQPRVAIAYEVSFTFVDRTFHFALHAPDPARRWELVPYEPTPADLAVAQRFVDWNDVEHGIQRIDCCRTDTGELLLVEVEDLNPYLSLDRVPPAARDRFVAAVIASLGDVLAG